MSEALTERRIGNVTVLFGDRGGKYPDGNSLVVRGREETAVIDPSLGLVRRGGARPRADRVLLSHCHEDHVAGCCLFPELPCHLHELDAPGIRSLEAMLEIYGYPEPIESQWRKALVERFRFAPRPDALEYRHDSVFDLGGVRVRAIHAPGHTRGHCLFHIEPDDVLFLADIDLSSFGPYYGDAWSSLDDFERTLGWVRDLEARYYATFHHIGVLEERAAFLERLDRYLAKIAQRESRLLEFLSEPRTLDEIVSHRFIYRPGDSVLFADAVERWSMQQHLTRLAAAGRVEELAPGTWGRSPRVRIRHEEGRR